VIATIKLKIPIYIPPSRPISEQIPYGQLLTHHYVLGLLCLSNMFQFQSTSPCLLLRHVVTPLQVADGGDHLQMWRVAVNVLND